MSNLVQAAQSTNIQAPTSKWDGTIKPVLLKASPMLSKVAPKHFSESIPRLIQCFNVASRKTPALLECDPKSIVLSLAQSAAIGIFPNTPANRAYLIPYKKECTLQISYPGLIELAMRTGLVAGVKGVAIYRNDEFDWQEGSVPKIVHRPSLLKRGGDEDIIGAYGLIQFRSGETQFRVLTLDDIKKRQAMAFAKGESGPWKDWYREMVEKTGIKYTLRQCSLSDSDETDRLMAAVNHDDRASSNEPIDVTTLDGFEEFAAPASTAGSLAEKAGAA